MPTESSSKSVVDVGTGNFSQFPFHVSVSLRGGYDDNTLSTTFNRHGSWFTNASVGLTYDFGSPRTQLRLQTGAGVSYYFDRPGSTDYDVNAYLGLSATHKASARLTFAASVYATYQVEPDFNFNAGTNRNNGNYFYTADKFSAAYLWAPRFSTVTSYTFGSTWYEESIIGTFEDRFEHTFGNEFRFLVWPTTTLVAEYRYEIVDYDRFPRDSQTHFLLGGFDHSFSPRFNVSFRGGVEFRDYDNFGSRTDPYFEGTVIYALGPRISLTWTNRYSIEEPDVPGSVSRTTFRTGLSMRYNVSDRIVAGASFFYQHDDNAGGPAGIISPAFSEDSFVILLSARYAITRNFGIDVGYDFSDVSSDIRLREYYRNRIYAGVNFAF
jgi:hypothetical protein